MFVCVRMCVHVNVCACVCICVACVACVCVCACVCVHVCLHRSEQWKLVMHILSQDIMWVGLIVSHLECSRTS